MKLIAFIIATYISLLTAQPVLSAVSSMSNNEMSECCGKNMCNNEQPQKKNNKSEQHKQCNPFQVCASCCGYIVTELSIEKVIFTEFINGKTGYIENKNSAFFSSYFQPPEII
jgi:hypothetical protein